MYVLMPVNSSVLKVYLFLISMFMDFCLVSGMLMIVGVMFAFLMFMHIGCAFVNMFVEMLVRVFMFVRMSMIMAFFFVLLSMHVRVLVSMPMGMRMLEPAVLPRFPCQGIRYPTLPRSLHGLLFPALSSAHKPNSARRKLIPTKALVY